MTAKGGDKVPGREGGDMDTKFLPCSWAYLINCSYRSSIHMIMSRIS